MSNNINFSGTLVFPQNWSEHDWVKCAERRILAVLERHLVANQRMLEQKISIHGQGPKPEPHIVGKAIKSLKSKNRIKSYRRQNHGASVEWYANSRQPESLVNSRLGVLVPLYANVTEKLHNHQIGDTLEIVIFKALQQANKLNPRFSFQGAFDLSATKNTNGRYIKVPAPNSINGNRTECRPDFIQHGYDSGPIIIECKNHREWIYYDNAIIRSLILEALNLDCVLVLVAPYIHRSTKVLLSSLGIIYYEIYRQHYPLDKLALANRAKDQNLLGFSNIISSETPDTRTEDFVANKLPLLMPDARKTFDNKKCLAQDFVDRRINANELLSRVIGSVSSDLPTTLSAISP